ncbi:serine hydrolase domain-containing protein [Pseudoduganella aquatica]|uniref:serine hydrolase domain-containing protein n=1 Tax=Pseudoduganella aquatica TaxID=2660641 RepID=UPI001E51342E|nr:serine hydrolase domain-containing protein [Pseudoduganella aquatica]
MPHLTSVFTVRLLLAAALAGCAASPPPALPAAAHAALDRELAALAADPQLGMASLSVLAVRDGRVAYRGGFGSRHLPPEDAAQNRPVTSATLYRIASVSKFVTTLGVMRLVDEGRLALDRDASDYLGFPLRNPAYPDRPITLRMLLTHTSSLRDEGGYSWPADVALQGALAGNAAAWDARHAPGRYFSYSNLNWGVVGTVMEAATGERFDLLMQRLVMAPLGLRGGFNVAALPQADLDNLAALYRKRGAEGAPWQAGGPWHAQADDYRRAKPQAPAGLAHYLPGRNGTLFSPTGGLRISADGLGAILLMLLDGGRHKGTPFLSPASMAAMFASEWRYEPAGANGDTHHGLFTHWGLGTQHFDGAAGAGSSLRRGGGYPASGHLGEAWGLLSVFAVDFQRRSGMVVLIGGTASDPFSTQGAYSALSRQEEAVLSALHKHVLPP